VLIQPIIRDSGTIRGYRITRGCGRKTIKKALFMSVLSVIRKENSHLNVFYKSLINKGKSKMTAYIACMRKLIVHLNGLIRKEYYENIFIN
jgi:transposase